MLERFHDFLAEWTQAPGRMPPETANWLAGRFLAEPLRDWDVSRPAPYFGFEIPDAPGHFFYVWLDAPVGYMSSTWDWCEQVGDDFERWWGNRGREIHHFIGKDIAYFHTLVLAGDAARLGASAADARSRARLPDRERREDEQAQGHVRARAHLSRAPLARLPPLLLRHASSRAAPPTST